VTPQERQVHSLPNHGQPSAHLEILERVSSVLLRAVLAKRGKRGVLLKGPRRTKILVVDDNKPFRAVLCKALNELGGFSIEEAESAEEALPWIEKTGFDLVLVDLRLPNMNGLDLITRIVDSKPEILTILMTAHADIDSAVEAMKRGASDYLTKPFVLEEVLARVRRVLEEKKRFGSIGNRQKGCVFGWDKLKEMKDNKIEFWAGDGLTRLRIVEVSDREEIIHMMTTEGKLTWPLKFQKLKEVHNKVHRREIGAMAYEIERYIPTWGNYVSGLFRYLGCDKATEKG
jgi:DNA-binding response OmpR family regulator